ncbi:NADH-ubiquinone oxidoreductase 20 kDa subunit [Paracoccidioides lutzii Pb01]|uniref:NADH-ubiquinone oxidoreductase 20 kDa subunit n=1 Tax=Paracoccidioides lutzii (strain ATCC MYA-826 / Pb01) TaxID=502779 RepID=C1GND6_PARBA|nr:NADH-ubiquinone oxidoreductase 20 kDa subunit [Paracoccidioides lutzii Pb01]EEH35708.2 NADH-ubiquinone oxidoreductase 20 kDa subunit [Paracoccidioides lutzii Pb01]
MAVSMPRYDQDRLGTIFRASPRQSDVIIVADAVTKQDGPRLAVTRGQVRGQAGSSRYLCSELSSNGRDIALSDYVGSQKDFQNEEYENYRK